MRLTAAEDKPFEGMFIAFVLLEPGSMGGTSLLCCHFYNRGPPTPGA